jgi:hypothetical protein
VQEDGRDSYGNSYRRSLGEMSWRHTPAQPDAPLTLPLSSRPTSAVLFLETDNGDNAPLQLSAVRVAFHPVNVVFKAPSTAPVELVYGNPRASAPRYDIQMVRAQFERVGKTNATLGAHAGADGRARSHAASSGAGSVWLWSALALVVVGLLWIVARMLPAEAASKEKS